MANFKLFGREIDTAQIKKEMQSTFDEMSQKASDTLETVGKTVNDTSKKIADSSSEVWNATSDAVSEAAAKAADTAQDAMEWLKDEENQEVIKNKAIDAWIAIDEATDKVDNVLDDPLAQKIIPAPIMGVINIVRSPLTITKHVLNNYVVTDEVREARMEAKMSDDGSAENPAETDDKSETGK